MRHRTVVVVALVVVIAACGVPGPSSLCYSHVGQVAGERKAYVDIEKVWTEHLTVDGSRERSKHLGVLAVDLDTFRARFERGREFRSLVAHDHRGRIFSDRYVEEEGPCREELAVDFEGRRRVLCIEEGTIGNLALAVQGEVTWVFFQRSPYEGVGSHAVGRVNAETGKVTHLPMPTSEPHVWDYLTAQDGRIVYLTGRERERGQWRYRTWRGDFGEGTWGEPIAGNFRVIDRRGTLLERRKDRWLSKNPGLPATAAEIIRKGRRETIDLALPGPIEPIFDTGWVVLKDRARGRVVLRSLDGKPDRWLPKAPPLRGEILLREE